MLIVQKANTFKQKQIHNLIKRNQATISYVRTIWTDMRSKQLQSTAQSNPNILPTLSLHVRIPHRLKAFEQGSYLKVFFPNRNYFSDYFLKCCIIIWFKTNPAVHKAVWKIMLTLLKRAEYSMHFTWENGLVNDPNPPIFWAKKNLLPMFTIFNCHSMSCYVWRKPERLGLLNVQFSRSKSHTCNLARFKPQLLHECHKHNMWY